MSRLAVFGYGSLVSRRSAAETLGRPVAAPIPARLEGFARGWILGRDNLTTEKMFARADGSVPRFCLGVGVDARPRRPGAQRRTDRAQRGGARPPRPARDALHAPRRDGRDPRRRSGRRAPPFDRVVTYRPRPENHKPEPPDDAIIVANYLSTVEAAFDELGPGQLDLFRATTAPPPVEVTGATLVRDRIPEGNPRGW